MVASAKKVWTPEEYLAFERASDEKHELISGELRLMHRKIELMSGAGLRHVRIVRNVVRHLDTQLDDSPCEILCNDMRTKIKLTESYTYPDIVGLCGEPEIEDEQLDTLLNPVLIIEILSPSTEAYDRCEKFQAYRSIETLQEYVLVSQDHPMIERYLRQADESWLLTDARGLDAVMTLTSMNCASKLADVY